MQISPQLPSTARIANKNRRRKGRHVAFGAAWILALIGASVAGVSFAQDSTPNDPNLTPSSEFPSTTEGAQDNSTEAPMETQQLGAAQTSGSCAENGMNVQCTEFGTIKMDARRDIRGDPIDVNAEILLSTGYADRGARWVMFSVYNVTDGGSSPVTIGVTAFTTVHGDIVTTRVEQPKPSEVNLWVDVLDLPIDSPISLKLRIGASERGAFSLETLVLAFDRGYAPVKDSQGNDASLFSFTLLGVNKETQSTAGDGGGVSNGNKLPSPGPLAAMAVLLVAALVVLRRRNA